MRLGDLLDSKEDIVVSTNTTFETAISNGPISPKSLQGLVLLGFFDGNTEDLDRQIKASLGGIEFSEGIRRCPLDTVAKVKAHGKNLYFVAMAELNAHGTAQSDLNGVSAALAGIWSFIASRGERADLAVPVMGTGRGRLGTGQQKMIEVIAQSFADASRERIFASWRSSYIRMTRRRKRSICSRCATISVGGSAPRNEKSGRSAFEH